MAGGFTMPTTNQIIMTLLIAIAFMYLIGQMITHEPCTTADLGTPCTADEYTAGTYGCSTANSVYHHEGTNLHGCTQAGANWYEINVPDTGQLESSSMFIFKLIIIGVLVIAAYAVVIRFMGGNFNRQAVMTLIVIAVILWVLWDVILSKVLNSPTLDGITFAVKSALAP